MAAERRRAAAPAGIGASDLRHPPRDAILNMHLKCFFGEPLPTCRLMTTPSTLSRALLLPLLLLAGAATAHAGEPGAPTPRPAATDTTLADPIARLQARIDAGQVELEMDSVYGYLPSLLRELDIPVSSQGLVFSRTSLQTDKIAPWAPRAIYFNDDVYIGYVQGSYFLEIASVDPDEGAVFYTLVEEEGEEPRFNRESTACLMCHNSRTVTDGVPGFMVLSTVVDRLGYPVLTIQDGATSDRTPHEDRYAGWYVTGTHEGLQHSGNTHSPLAYDEVREKERHVAAFDRKSGGNLVELEAKFHTGAYLTPHSDIVALMVLTHQAKVHNLMTALHEASTEAFRTEPGLRRAGASADAGPRTSGLLRIVGAADRLASAMLFSGEAPLSGKVTGTAGFAEEFEALGPFDSQGRSLRELDLEKRLFRYPLSFLVYSESFEALPEVAKRAVYRRLWEVLSGMDSSDEFDHLDAADRRAILEILEETKPEFAALRPDTGGPTAR